MLRRNDAPGTTRALTALTGGALLLFLQPLAPAKAGPEASDHCHAASALKSHVADIIRAMQLEPYDKLDAKLRREVTEYGAALCSERHARQDAMARFTESRDRYIAACRENGARAFDSAAVSAEAARMVEQCVKLRSSALRLHVPLELIAKETITGICLTAVAHVFDSPDDVANIDRLIPSRKDF